MADCGLQAFHDAVSAYAQVRMKEASWTLSNDQTMGAHMFGFDFLEPSTTRMRHHRGPFVTLEVNMFGHLLSRPMWERRLEDIVIERGWDKVQSWDFLTFIGKHCCF